MDNKKIDAIAETMRELFEATQNTTIIDAHTRLMQGVDKIDWREQQLAAMGAYKRKLKDNLKKFKVVIEQKMWRQHASNPRR